MSNIKDLLNISNSVRLQLFLIVFEKFCTDGVRFKINIKNSDKQKSFYRKNSIHRRFNENIGQLAYIIEDIFKNRAMPNPFLNKIIQNLDFSQAIDMMVFDVNYPVLFGSDRFNFDLLKNVDIEVNGHRFTTHILTSSAIIQSIPFESPLNKIDYFNPMTLEIKVKYNLKKDLDQCIESFEYSYKQYLSIMKKKGEESIFNTNFRKGIMNDSVLKASNKHPEAFRALSSHLRKACDISLDNDNGVTDFINLLENPDIDQLILDYKSNKVFEGDLTFGKGKKFNKINFYK